MRISNLPLQPRWLFKIFWSPPYYKGHCYKNHKIQFSHWLGIKVHCQDGVTDNIIARENHPHLLSVFYLALQWHVLCAPGKHFVRPSRHMRYMALGMRANGSKCSLSMIEWVCKKTPNFSRVADCYPRSAPPNLSGSEEGQSSTVFCDFVQNFRAFSSIQR